jgi:hypothetical protein
MTERIEQFLEDHVDGEGVLDYPSAVDALAATGLLSPGRAASWKAEHARLRALGSGHEGPFDEEVEARATELLEALFAPVRREASDEWDAAVFQRYQQALWTLTAIRALSHKRARPWTRRHQQTLTPGSRPEPAPDPEMLFAAGELSAVLIGPPERLDRMRVTRLELYGDCVIVRYHQLLPPEPADPVERRELLTTPFELEDDAGTAYRPAPIPTPRGCKPREVEGWPDALGGWQAFVPGAPLGAREFSVDWREQRFTLSLGGSGVQ